MLTGLLLSAGLLGVTTTQAAEVVKDGQVYWQVEANDTLSHIGEYYGINFYDIQAANSDKIYDVNLIFDGDLLLIPTKEGAVSQPTYTSVSESVYQEPVIQEEVYVAPVQAPAPASSYTSNGGGLTKQGGVFYGPSGKETYYSQRV